MTESVQCYMTHTLSFVHALPCHFPGRIIYIEDAGMQLLSSDNYVCNLQLFTKLMQFTIIHKTNATGNAQYTHRCWWAEHKDMWRCWLLTNGYMQRLSMPTLGWSSLLHSLQIAWCHVRQQSPLLLYSSLLFSISHIHTCSPARENVPFY